MKTFIVLSFQVRLVKISAWFKNIFTEDCKRLQFYEQQNFPKNKFNLLPTFFLSKLKNFIIAKSLDISCFTYIRQFIFLLFYPYLRIRYLKHLETRQDRKKYTLLIKIKSKILNTGFRFYINSIYSVYAYTVTQEKKLLQSTN